jgi:hypothetical protein
MFSSIADPKRPVGHPIETRNKTISMVCARPSIAMDATIQGAFWYVHVPTQKIYGIFTSNGIAQDSTYLALF